MKSCYCFSCLVIVTVLFVFAGCNDNSGTEDSTVADNNNDNDNNDDDNDKDNEDDTINNQPNKFMQELLRIIFYNLLIITVIHTHYFKGKHNLCPLIKISYQYML